jgi:hypothetical protein
MRITTLSQLNALRDGETATLAAIEWRDAKITLQARKNIILEAETGARFTGSSALLLSQCSKVTVRSLHFTNGDLNQFGSDAAVIRLEACTDTIVRNCTVDGINPPTPTRAKEYKYLFIKSSPRTTVEGCRFLNKHNGSAALAVNSDANVPDGCTIRRCLFKNIGPLSAQEDGNGYESIRLSDSKRSLESSQSLIEECVFVNCGSRGEPETVSLKRCDITVRRCSLYNCKGFLTARHGKRNRFIENYIKDSWGGIRLIDSDHTVEGNFITGIQGDGGFRQAIVLVKGQPGSPINGYFAANNAVIRNNTLLNNSHDIGITDGGKDELTIEPQNIRISEGHSPYAAGTLKPLTEADLAGSASGGDAGGLTALLQDVLTKVNALTQRNDTLTQKVDTLSEHLGVR